MGARRAVSAAVLQAWLAPASTAPLCWSPAVSQVVLTFPRKPPLDGMEYTITATASNEFGESAESEPFQYKAPLKPAPPTVTYIAVPDEERETYGPLAVVVTYAEGASRELLPLHPTKLPCISASWAWFTWP